MITIKDKSKCSGCGACFAVCNKKCITMIADNEGFKYPVVDANACLNCGLCEKTCPILKKSVLNKRPVAYATYNIDESVRLNSSSGGVFNLLAKYFIENGGVVFGAEYDKDFNVIHNFAESMDEVKKFMGSKYVQSDTTKTFETAKNFLNDGRLVLFTGTPCQIAGLKNYLKKDYENLYCQDIICHGVPSPAVWQRYLDYRKKKAKANIKQIFLRNKDDGWKNFSVCLEFQNGITYKRFHRKDLFIKSYLQNLILRPSCYECYFKTIERVSDITLADFWGCEKVVPEMDDNKGTSLVLCHSNKGRELFNVACSKAVYKTVDFDKAIECNLSMIKSTSKNLKRDEFIKEIKNNDFNKTVKKYTNAKFNVRVKNKMEFLFKKYFEKR